MMRSVQTLRPTAKYVLVLSTKIACLHFSFHFCNLQHIY